MFSPNNEHLLYRGTKHEIYRGQQFGALTAVARDHDVKLDANGKSRAFILCLCRCSDVVSAFVSDLITGKTTRCGRCGYYDEHSKLENWDVPLVHTATTEMKLHPVHEGVWCGRDGSIWSGWVGSGDTRVNVHRPVHKISQCMTAGGYLCCGVPSYVVVRKTAWAHRLVLEAWRGLQPEWADSCRHLNGVRDDNRLSNLEWGTAQDQADDKSRHGSRPYRLSISDVRLLTEGIPLSIRDSDALALAIKRTGNSRIQYDSVRRVRRKARLSLLAQSR